MRLSKGLVRVQRKLDEVLRCGTCGKSISVAVVPAGRKMVPEKVTRDTHCFCEGGPAHDLPKRK